MGVEICTEIFNRRNDSTSVCKHVMEKKVLQYITVATCINSLPPYCVIGGKSLQERHKVQVMT